eukprot:30834-Pelagococcus_subviridis.AAC.1
MRRRPNGFVFTTSTVWNALCPRCKTSSTCAMDEAEVGGGVMKRGRMRQRERRDGDEDARARERESERALGRGRPTREVRFARRRRRGGEASEDGDGERRWMDGRRGRLRQSVRRSSLARRRRDDDDRSRGARAHPVRDREAFLQGFVVPVSFIEHVRADVLRRRHRGRRGRRGAIGK